MKKDNLTGQDDLCAEYNRSTCLKTFQRGKYATRIRESSNIVVLKKPEVAGSISQMKKQ